MLLVLNLPMIGLWVKLLKVPKPWLYAGILLFATLGTIGANPSSFELGLLLAFGVLGYLMDKYKFPVSPIVLALILGPMVESEFRRSLLLSSGSFSIFFTRPICVAILTLTVISVVGAYIQQRKKHRLLKLEN